MKIKLIQSLVGNGWSVNPGDVVDRPAPEAKRLIEAGFAIPSKGADIETTAWGLPENVEVA